MVRLHLRHLKTSVLEFEDRFEVPSVNSRINATEEHNDAPHSGTRWDSLPLEICKSFLQSRLMNNELYIIAFAELWVIKFGVIVEELGGGVGFLR